MRLLVLSDSHAALSFMRLCAGTLKPDVIIHLGDYYEDGSVIAEEFSQIRFYQVPGNCDRYRFDLNVPETLVENVGGVKLFMTHGHRHGVKQSLHRLITDAQSVGAKAVLFGHTHQAHCQLEDGLWVVNPGSCGYHGGTAALIQIDNREISDCRIVGQSDILAEIKEGSGRQG